MSYIVDRRLNGKDKSSVNRKRFLDRYKKQIREAVSDAATERSITDLDSGETVTIPQRNISEPVFQHGEGGDRSIIHTGNKEFVTGDEVQRPESGGGGSGSGQASDSGEGDDEFMFSLSRDEYLDFLFDGLELPNLVKQHLKGTDNFRYKHAGVVSDGNPSKINIIRSMRTSLSRRMALGGSARKRLKEAKLELQLLLQEDADAEQQAKVELLEEEIKKLMDRLTRIPYLDTYDLRYNHHVKDPIPSAQAVMFCLMDVSGSMTQSMKEMAKRFYMLLYLFLERSYEKTEIVFIRHHTSAKEVDEQEFFYSREAGGTVVSSALKLMDQIITERYPVDQWNIYGAQASDGDNWNDDSPVCKKFLTEKLLPMSQYFTYVEIMPRTHQSLWDEYKLVEGTCGDQFAMQEIKSLEDIYPVFRELFQRREL
ncbi:MAG: YeaH/YhbH family protein [Pseudomonadales bacterium]|nr:YeaH/YhbH family protein [Pseudomonadales bacterium]